MVEVSTQANQGIDPKGKPVAGYKINNWDQQIQLNIYSQID